MITNWLHFIPLWNKKLIWHGLIFIHGLQNNHIDDEGVAVCKALRGMSNLQYLELDIYL